MIGVYVLGVPLIVIVLTVFGVGAFIGYFWLDLSRTAKIALELATALIFIALAASAFAQTSHAAANSHVKRLDHPITIFCEGSSPGSAVASVGLRPLRSER